MDVRARTARGPGSERRNARLESFLVRALTPAGGPGHLPFYEPCVVSGPDGPVPYFAYLILWSDALLAVRWPSPKALETLVRFEDVSGVAAVADTDPAFLLSPYKERAQHVRIEFRNRKRQEAEAAIDLYLLNSPATEFPKLLQRLWIRRLIGCTLGGSIVDSHAVERPHDLITFLTCSFSGGSCHYDRLLRVVERYGSNRKWALTCACSAAFRAKREADFRQVFWRDSQVLRWLLDRVQQWTLDGDYGAALRLLRSLTAILDAVDSATSWPMLQPHLRRLSDAVVRMATIEDDDCGASPIVVCARVWRSVLDLPTLPDQTPLPVTALVTALLLNPAWEACVTRVMQMGFDLLTTEGPFRPRQVIVLFETFDVIGRMLGAENSKLIADVMESHFSEEFRYFASTARIDSKFPERCFVKERVLAAIDKLKSVVLNIA